jgi:hypothetical protein
MRDWDTRGGRFFGSLAAFDRITEVAIADKLKTVPTSAGIYLHKNLAGKIL